LTDPSSGLDLSVPRTNGQVFAVAFRIYSRWAHLFIFLGAIALIPYGAVTVILTGAKHVATSTELILALADIAIVNPFIAAMQMQALTDLGDRRSPVLTDVLRRGLAVLPVVAAADIIAGLPEFVGLIYPLFVIPGLLAAVRLVVAAPVAAAEHVTWLDAVRRSVRLTRGNAWRVFGLLLIQAVLTLVIASLVGTSAISVAIVGVALAIVAQSFFTLVIALLYFDLRAREAGPVRSA
jgi:hypothetical protein